MTEETKEVIRNANCVIELIQNDLFNKEGSCVEEITYGALELVKESLNNIKDE